MQNLEVKIKIGIKSSTRDSYTYIHIGSRTRSRLTCFFSELCQIKFVSVFVWYTAARGACLRCSCVSEHYFVEKGPRILRICRKLEVSET